MPNLRKFCLMSESLSYAPASTRTLFENIHVSLSADDRVALVGDNGVGKSTLLKILAGQIHPTHGSVTCKSSIYYLPQISTFQNSSRSESLLDFLSTVSSQWWEIVQVLERSFGTELDLSMTMRELSGGELAKVLLAVGWSQSPDLLLLDEPTNHLDYLALEDLQQLLNAFQGAYVLVSHNAFFLDQVAKTVWELTPAGLQVYGGNFSEYRDQKQQEEAAKVRSHQTARKELKRVKAAAMQEQKRAAQSSRNGRRNAANIPRVVAGAQKRRAENTAAKLKVKHEQAIAGAQQRLAETKVRTSRVTNISLEQKDRKHRMLIHVRDAHLWVDNRLLLKDIGLQISSCDRISLIGPNGSGKSCLINAILDRESPASLRGGEVQRAEMQTVYLDQHYASVNRSLTVLENLQKANPDLSYQLLRQQLGHFLFFGDDVHKPVAVLSGGELARVAIAMITVSAIDLLVLDEPTNNLDIATVDQMVATLNQYQGALWIISHDLDFLSRLQITHSFQIKDQVLQQTPVLPKDRSNYRKHVVKEQ